MSQQRIPLPPPWCLMLFGAIFLYWAYEHYLKLIEFDEGRIDRMSMYWFMILIYETTGFWPTAILPFVAAGTVALSGVVLQVQDLRSRMQGKVAEFSYEPVHWKGLLTALLVVASVIALFMGIAFVL